MPPIYGELFYIRECTFIFAGNRMRRIVMKKILVLLCFTFIISLPFLYWQLLDKKKVNVVVVDKTVPDDTYREHYGLIWFLNHFKYTKPNFDSYDVEEDYSGFVPLKKDKYKIREYKTHNDSIDLLYLTDTYGVYEEEFYQTNEKGRRSKLIEGGLKLEEWRRIQQDLWVHQPHFLVEFNSFASPTSSLVRNELTSLLNIEWTGWIGRYFNELNRKKKNEVPIWAFEEYNKQNKEEWAFSGPGYLLVNESGKIVILEESEDVGKGGISLHYTEKGREEFGLQESPPYRYWFDIIIPKDEEEVLAYYDWKLTKKGKEKIKEANIPLKSAAITKTEYSTSPAYYFAGDYTDVANLPNIYRAKGLADLRRFMMNFNEEHEEAFYWKNYIPMMEYILSEASNREESNETK